MKRCAEFLHECPQRRRFRALLGLGWHFTGLHAIEDVHPAVESIPISGLEPKRGEIEIPFSVVGIMTVDAVPFEKGVDRRRQGRPTRGGENYRRQSEKEIGQPGHRMGLGHSTLRALFSACYSNSA